MAIEVRTLMQGKGESDSRRKKVEAQLQEVQLKYAESERQRLELGEKLGKVQVPSERCFCCGLYNSGTLNLWVLVLLLLHNRVVFPFLHVFLHFHFPPD